ncbi:MAG TPA: VWA domain-containing protein [Acidobacteriota bacterium]|nr:VWA domain-containing protein [Acidobacteriota bacterium]HQM63717.1 VWA domain-containing protein [Acidobacteriota bacterium]
MMHRALTILAVIGVLAFWGTAQAQTADSDMYSSIRVNVDSVRVRVAVSDSLNRFVTGLQAEHFKVYEDKVEQEVVNFTSEASPVSIGLIFDTSFSMKPKINKARQSAIGFLDDGTRQDEFFLVLFSDRARLAQDITTDLRQIQGKISDSEARGSTALFDAIYIGLDKIRQCRHAKKALIVITDGEDNHSRYTFAEIKEFAREVDCQIYVLGEHGTEGYGEGIIQELSRMTGGRVFFPNSLEELDYFVELIHSELRHQYVLGYIPSNTRRDATWRKITLKLDPPPGLPKLFVHHREGYYAPRQ